MSQSVQLDMEVLQRIKFLMEYDVMKTSSENILVEQDLGLKGKTIAPSAKPPANFGQSQGGLSEKTLEEFTVEVREFMSRWEVATVETMMTYAGVGIPVVLGANGFWMTLEIIQASKGKPDWWSLVFSILSTLTVGSQAAWLKPLYKLGGKGVGSLFEALDLLYQNAKLYQTGTKTATGVLDDLILLLKDLTPKLPKLIGIISTGIEWLSKTKLGQKAKVVLQTAKDWLSGTIKSIGDWVSKYMDAPLYKLGRKQGVDSATSRNIGGAVRWGTGVGTGGYLLQRDKKDTTNNEFTNTPYKYPPGTFAGN
jgi:hypothetical protein